MSSELASLALKHLRSEEVQSKKREAKGPVVVTDRNSDGRSNVRIDYLGPPKSILSHFHLPTVYCKDIVSQSFLLLA